MASSRCRHYLYVRQIAFNFSSSREETTASLIPSTD